MSKPSPSPEQTEQAESSESLVGRLAPSPTGQLHVGHARSFLLAWLSIRSRGGLLHLRLEDLDRSRVKAGMVNACLRDLEWLGLDWDGPIDLQSAQQEVLYQRALDLHAAGQAYPCVCTRREIEEAQSAPHAEDRGAIYPGTCRDKFDSLEEARRVSGREPALRLRVPEGVTHVHDQRHGSFEQEVAREVGDFPLTSRDGQVAYQLAVVVDDARQGVNEVVRGDDLLDSTPRQALLHELLGLERPTWVHVPLVLDEARERLAKRHDALSLLALREAGVDAGEFLGWLARSCGIESPRSTKAADLVSEFRWEALPSEPVVFDASHWRAELG